MSKYNNLKILFKYKKIILRRFEKEFGENKNFKHYDYLSEEIKRKLFSFVITDIIELVCDSFKENGLIITKEDYFEQIRKSKGNIIHNDEEFISYIIVSFKTYLKRGKLYAVNSKRYDDDVEDFIRQPINLTLYWNATNYGWSKCNKSHNTYLNVINKLNDGEI